MSFIFESKVLDIQKFKIMYVKQRITENKFKKDNDKLLKIDCFDAFDKDGYSHFFLVGEKGGVVNHKYDDSILLYRKLNESLEQVRILDNSIVIPNDFYIMEILRMKKIDDIDYVYQLGCKYLWRIDEILRILGTPDDNMIRSMYLSHDNINNVIAWKYSIDKYDIDKMNDIYFYKLDNLPLRLQSKNEIINDSNNWGSLVPFQFWNFSLIPINSCPKKSLRDSIEKNNRCLTKSYIASSKIYSD